jgi:hypothetical protein
MYTTTMEDLLRKYALQSVGEWQSPSEKQLQQSLEDMGVRFVLTLTLLDMIEDQIFRVLQENFDYMYNLSVGDVEFTGSTLSMISIQGFGIFDTAKIYISPEYIVTIVFSEEKSVVIEY